MAQDHEWVLDVEQSMDMNSKCGANPLGSQFLIHRCSNCGCIRITDWSKFGQGGMNVYKPNEWTWNPFKTLKSEPPCPAHW